jgi:hypothetical protein
MMCWRVESSMPRSLILAIVVVVFVVGALHATAQSQSKPATTEQRVILIINRNEERPGFVVSEDEQQIVIRTPGGEEQTHPKPRVLHIVRLVDPAPGQSGMVVLRNGQTREGIIIADAFDHVLMEIEGIRAKLERSTVSHVILEPTFDDRYSQAKAAIASDNFDAWLVLCHWLVDQRRYDLAREELLDLLEKTEMPEARKLLTTVEAQLALKAPRSKIDPDEPLNESDPAAQHERTGPVYPRDILPNQTLSAADVNIVRVYEIDFDHPPKVFVSPDTIRTLIETHGTNKLIPSSQTGRNAMFRAEPLDLVRVMFELRARELYPRIEVKTEPHSLNLFRQRVHDTWLVNNCATTHCHGGVEGAPLFLYARNYKNERVRYTNLLILERLTLDSEWPLINYDRPEDSLVLQYGLPRESARKPHPKVPGWKPVFTDTSHRLWQGSIEWVRAMMMPRPEYPVEYDPPRLERPALAGNSQDGQDSRQPR